MLTIVLSALSSFAARVHCAAPIQFLRRHKDGLIARRIRNGYVNQRLLKVLLFALEAKAAARHVFARDNIVLQVWPPHASLEGHAHARVLSPILALLRGNAGAG